MTNAIQTQREYLVDAKFEVFLGSEDKASLETIAAAIRNPCWFLYLGRKNCAPNAPIIQEPYLFDGDPRTVVRQRMEAAALEHAEGPTGDMTLGDCDAAMSLQFEVLPGSPAPSTGVCTVRHDRPVNFETREFLPRLVYTEMTP